MAFGIIRRIANATQALAGLMSAADKTKLDGIEAGATATAQPQDNLSSESTTAPLSANQGRVLKGLIDGSGITTETYSPSVSVASGDTSYLFIASKYGRMVVLSCSSGGATTAALTAGQTIATLGQAYRPDRGLWFNCSTAAGTMARMTVESSGAVKVQQAVAAGAYLRFTVAYTSLA